MKSKFGILCSCFIMMSYLALSPVIASISLEFPEVSISVVQMLITLPALVSLISSVGAGKLVSKYYKKTLVLWSMGVYLAGGLLPLMYSGTIWFLLFCSGLMGLGTGGMMTLSASLICDYYDGEERDRMMGFQAACISGGGMVFTMAGGRLAGWGWRSVYLVYLLIIPCLLLVCFFLPKGRLEVSKEEKSPVLSGAVCFLAVIGFVFYVCQNVFNTNISLFLTETGLGNAQTAGLATSVNTFAGMLAGVLLGKSMKLCRSYSVTAAVASACLGLFITFISGGILCILVGGFLVGFGFSMFTPAGTLMAAGYAPASQRSITIAFFSSVCNVGAALSPVIINQITSYIGHEVRFKFIIGSGILLIVAFVSLALAVGRKNER